MNRTNSSADHIPLLQVKQDGSFQPPVESSIGSPPKAGTAHSDATSPKPPPGQFDSSHQRIFEPRTDETTACETPQAYHMEFRRDRRDLTISGHFADRSFRTFDFPTALSTKSGVQDVNKPTQKEKPLTAKEEPESRTGSILTYAGSFDHDGNQRHYPTGSMKERTGTTAYRPASVPTSTPPVDLTLDDLEKSSNLNHRNDQKSGTEFTAYGQGHGKLVLDLTQRISDGCSTRRPVQRTSLQRNSSIAYTTKKLDSYTFNNIKINSKANVELSDGDFMRIVDVLQDTTTLSISLRGWIFRRTRQMNGLLERKTNELCWIMHVDEDDSRDPTIQAMVTVPVSSVKSRRKIRMTNKPFPAYSFREDACQDDEQTILQERVLICRFKYICMYSNAQARERYVWSEKAICRLRGGECDPLLAEPDDQLRYQWRGETEKGGGGKVLSTKSHEQRRISAPFISDTNEMRTPHLARSEDVIEVDPPSPTLQTLRHNRKRRNSCIMTEPSSSGPEKAIGGVDSTTNTKSSSLAMTDALHQSIFESLSHREIRSSSPEIIDIDLRIKTVTKEGTLERRYESRVTSTFNSHTSPVVREKNESRIRDFGPPVKRSKNAHSQIAEATLSTRVNEKVRRSLSPAASESTVRGSISPPPIEKLGQHASHISDPNVRSSREPRTSLNQGSRHPTTTVLALPIQGGSVISSPKTAPSLFVPLGSSESKRTAKLQQYTFGDCFCGAGGMARGARDAGLDVSWGFDFNQHACETYEMNFPEARVYNKWAHEIPSLTECFKVDICHLSPPCQFFSPAHTVMGKDDDMNTASLFAINELLKKAKPRVVTLEQTSGLISGHELYFNAVIQIFVTLGFSIRWRVMNCADFGLPQRRSRIFMIASW